eukprot:SAG31_NODE_3330_length_4398_cov_5.734589_5_plen_157_part_00
MRCGVVRRAAGILPHSHKLPEAEHPKTTWGQFERSQFHPDAVAAVAPAGSVLLFDCRVYHTKAPNDTDEPRIAVQVAISAYVHIYRFSIYIDQKTCGFSLARDKPDGVIHLNYLICCDRYGTVVDGMPMHAGRTTLVIKEGAPHCQSVCSIRYRPE